MAVREILLDAAGQPAMAFAASIFAIRSVELSA
jgi:hypothetical protein